MVRYGGGSWVARRRITKEIIVRPSSNATKGRSVLGPFRIACFKVSLSGVRPNLVKLDFLFAGISLIWVGSVRKFQLAKKNSRRGIFPTLEFL